MYQNTTPSFSPASVESDHSFIADMQRRSQRSRDVVNDGFPPELLLGDPARLPWYLRARRGLAKVFALLSVATRRGHRVRLVGLQRPVGPRKLRTRAT